MNLRPHDDDDRFVGGGKDANADGAKRWKLGISLNGVYQNEDDDGPSDGGMPPLVPAAPFVPLDEVARENAASDRRCWGCEMDFGQPANPLEKVQMAKLWQIYQSGRGDVDDVALAESMHQAHEELFRADMLREGRDCLEWPADLILRHIQLHMVQPKSRVYDMIRDMDTVMCIIKNTMVRREIGPDGAGPPTVDEQKVKLLIACGKHKLELLAAPLAKMIGHKATFDV